MTPPGGLSPTSGMRTLLAAAALCLLAACDDGGTAASGADGATPVDAAVDATAVDAQPMDAALPDAALPDAALPDAEPRPYPEPGAWPPERGPGGPAVSFPEEALLQNCGFVDVGPDDIADHHNMVTMYDGYLAMPWSPEFGLTGGLTFFDFSDPCAPVVVGHGTTDQMRESHTIGFAQAGEGRYAVVAHQFNLTTGGVLFWDVSDVTQPTVAGKLAVPGFFYPDAYARVVLSTFWQAPYVFAGGSDNGVYVIDASDPTQPSLVTQYVFEPTLRVGQVQVVGNLLVATAAEGTRVALLDVSNPADPQPVPGGDFIATDTDGVAREWYFSNLSGGFLYLMRKEDGGGLIIWDLHDPTRPVMAGGLRNGRNGGYVFVKDQLAFTGESSAAAIYDVSDPAQVTELGVLNLKGDLDTATPIGNVVVLSVDDKADPDQASAVAPYATEPDATPPKVTWVWPPDGAVDLAPTSRFGLVFSEFVSVKSVWAGSLRLYRADREPALGRVDGHFAVQENIVNFWPATPLARGVTYRLEVPAGGIADFNGNRITEPFAATFTIGR